MNNNNAIIDEQAYKDSREAYEISNSKMLFLSKMFLMFVYCSKSVMDDVKAGLANLINKEYTIEELKSIYSVKVEKYRMLINFELKIKKNLGYFYELSFINNYLIDEDKFIYYSIESLCGNSDYFLNVGYKIYWDVLDWLNCKYKIYADEESNEKLMKFGYSLVEQNINNLFEMLEAYVYLKNTKSNLSEYINKKEYITLNPLLMQFNEEINNIYEKVLTIKQENK